jgi:ATP-dependent helicase/nuclease subunit A
MEDRMSSPTPELKSEIVRAGAGAGKTTQLTRRVLEFTLRFKEKNNKLPRIIVTTFTRKATEELRERLLREAAKSKNAELIEFVLNPALLHISTMHGVLVKFLRRYGHLIEMDSGFSVQSSTMGLKIKRRFLRKLLLEHPRFQTLLEQFSTTELVYLLNEFVDQTTEPTPASQESLQELVESYIQTARDELFEQCEIILAECHDEKWLRALGDLKSLMGTPQTPCPSNGSELAEKLAGFRLPSFIKKSPPYSEELNIELKACIEKIKSLEEPQFQVASAEAFAQSANLFYNLAKEFRARLDANAKLTGAVEMRDLERYTYNAIKMAPALAEAFSSDFDFWLVDEFQDTSPLQVELFRALMGTRSGYFVGDPQQSIYLFRGARSEVFALKEKEIEKNGGELTTLDINYRSVPGLLYFFNDLFSTFSQAFMNMKPRPNAEPSAAARVCQVVISQKEDETPYSGIVKIIIARLLDGEKLDDFCILARKNSELKEVAKYLELQNIPTHIHSGGRFFERREILDLLSLLKFLIQPHDNKNLVRLLRSPWVKVTDSDLIRVTSKSPVFLYKALKTEYPEHTALKTLDQLAQRAQVEGVFETLRAATIELKMIELAHFHDPTGRREANMWKFFSLLKRKEKTPGFSYLQFVQDAFSESGSSDGEDESDAVAALEPMCVNLMTIHKSKGLKFQNVILIDMHKSAQLAESRGHKKLFVVDETTNEFTIGLRFGEDREFGHSLLAEKVLVEVSERERAEQDRLLYVALTRAAKSVILQWIDKPHARSWAAVAQKFIENHSVEHREIAEQYKIEVFDNSQMADAPNYEYTETAKTVVRAPYEFHGEATSKTISVTRLLEERESVETSASEPAVTVLRKKQLLMPVIGQKLHTLFERLKYDPTLDCDHYINHWFGSDARDIREAVAHALKIQKPPLRKIIANGHVEWGFQLRAKNKIIEGQIDLWGGDGNVTWLLDYKSGTSRSLEKSFTQLDLYSLALREFGVQGEIFCGVIYLLEKKVEIRPARDAGVIRDEFGIG